MRSLGVYVKPLADAVLITPRHAASEVHLEKNESPLAQSEEQGPTRLVPPSLGHRHTCYMHVFT